MGFSFITSQQKNIKVSREKIRGMVRKATSIIPQDANAFVWTSASELFQIK